MSTKENKFVIALHGKKLENGKWSLKVFDDIKPFPIAELDDALEFLAEQGFDSRPAFFEVTDEVRDERGNIKVEIDHAPIGPCEFTTEDLRGMEEYPWHVNLDDVRYFLFTTGDGEEDILEWVVVFPVNE